MKAVRWHARGDLRLDEVPMPTPGDDEVLVQVTHSGICGSEVHELAKGPIYIPLEPHPITGSAAPQIMGHEFGGRIVARGRHVDTPSEGTLVAVNPVLGCGTCEFCRRGSPNLCPTLVFYGLIGDGGHAEYAVVKARSCVAIPPDAPPEVVAFGEPAGVAFHAVNRAAVTGGETVLVIGGGPIGQLVAAYAKLAGAEMVVMSEPIEGRAAFARGSTSVDVLLDPVGEDVPTAVAELTGGSGVDIAIECSGGGTTSLLRDAAVEAVESVKAEGTVIIVGTYEEPTLFHFNNLVLMERTLMGSWVYRDSDEFRAAMAFLVDGRIDVVPMVTKRVSLDHAIRDGVQTLRFKSEEHLKILVDLGLEH